MVLIILPFSNLYNNERSYLRYIGLISVVVIFYTFVQIMLIMKNIDLGYIKGVFTLSHLKPDLTSVAVAGYFFNGVSHLAIYNHVFAKLSPARTCLLFLTFGILTATFTVLVPVGIWGPVAVQKVQLIWIVTSDTLSTELFIIERVLGYGTAVMVTAFCAYQLSSLLMFIFCNVKEGRVNNEEVI